jgi:Leucine-rich repeat (LRR) protein
MDVVPQYSTPAFNRAKERILKCSGKTWLLDLSNCNLTSDDFAQIFLDPELKRILEDVYKLNFSRNNITYIPEIDLKNLYGLNLSYNQITTIPKSIEYLKELRLLELENNYITEVPELVGLKLTGLILNNNLIRGGIESVIENCKYLDLIELLNNPISQETKSFLNHCKQFGIRVYFNENICDLYGDCSHIIHTLDLNTEEKVAIKDLVGKNSLLKEFLLKSQPLDYIVKEGLKHILQTLILGNNENKAEILHAIEICNNSEISVKDFLTQKYFASFTARGEEISESVLLKCAINNDIIRKLVSIEHFSEQAGFCNALLDTLFDHSSNNSPLKIKVPEKYKLPSTNESNPNFGYNMLSDPSYQSIIEGFIKHVCICNDIGEPIKDKEGVYIFDEEKCNAIVRNYLINQTYKQIEELLLQDEFSDLLNNPDIMNIDHMQALIYATQDQSLTQSEKLCKRYYKKFKKSLQNFKIAQNVKNPRSNSTQEERKEVNSSALSSLEGGKKRNECQIF